MDSQESDQIKLSDIDAAAKRIHSRIRRTPCFPASLTRDPIHPNLILKLENMQVTGSFKSRGANNAVLSLDKKDLRRGIITASGGNHGTAVAYAGNSANVKTVVYLPNTVHKSKVQSLYNWGAEVVLWGNVWDDANEAALQRAKKDKLTYIHPFADPAVIAGQATVAREMLYQSPNIDVIVAGIGGGGLISGVALAAKSIKPKIRVIGVEPLGAPTLKTSIAQNAVIKLEQINTKAITLAPKQSAKINIGLITRLVDEIVLVDDDSMRKSARWLFDELGIAAELSGAAALAGLQTGVISVPADKVVAAIVCGRGFDGVA